MKFFPFESALEFFQRVLSFICLEKYTHIHVNMYLCKLISLFIYRKYLHTKEIHKKSLKIKLYKRHFDPLFSKI